MSRYLFVLLGGCAQLAGIDETTGPLPETAATLSIDRFSIGATTVQAPLDLTGLTATFLEVDPADPTGFRRTPAVASGSTWAADVEGGAPSILFTTPEVPTPATRLYAFGQRSIRTLFTIQEHPAPTPPPDGATITTAVTLDAAIVGNELLAFYVAGAWNQRLYPAQAVGATALNDTFLYSEVGSLTNRPIEKFTLDDAVLVLKYVGVTLTATLDLPGFEQTGTDTVAGTMVTNTVDQVVDIPIDPTAIANRIGAGRPAVGGLGINWFIAAAPGSKAAVSQGPVLTSGGIAMADTRLATTYGNPFGLRGWAPTLHLVATMSRVFTPPTLALPVTLTGQLSELTESVVGFDATLPAALPALITIGSAPILTDGIDLKLDLTKAVPVSFVTDKPGSTLYQVQLIEFALDAAGTGVETHLRLTASALTPSFDLPPEFFVVGKVYTLRVICVQGGYPGIATGDLIDRQLPWAQGYFDSGVFTVVP